MHARYRFALCAASAVGAVFAAPAFAQGQAGAPSNATTAQVQTTSPQAQSAPTTTQEPPTTAQASAAVTGATPTNATPARTARDGTVLSDVVVTARRVEERLQDVPISITVFNQQQISKLNIFNAGDLANYTPSLQSDSRFGSENTSFAIRGFVQDPETSPSVGVYFADVTALRGAANGITGADGAGPGDLFDLQNVQVLKGPQGTLFGRNTTGGAVLLVPQKPTGRLEGYVEGSGGSYDMTRFQGVVNIPISDRIRFRGGVDYMDRDGYMKNTTGVGPDNFDNVHYIAARASLVIDVTKDIENYSIVSYSLSDNNGELPHVFECALKGEFSAFSSTFVCPALKGKQGFTIDGNGNLNSGLNNIYSGTNPLSNPKVSNEQMRFINTTTWRATDYLTIKNIASYGQYHTTYRNNLFGDNSTVPGFFGPAGGTPFIVVASSPIPGSISGAEQTFTDELQVQGNILNDALTYQAGVYYAYSLPLGQSDAFSTAFVNCTPSIGFSSCVDPLPGLLPSTLTPRIARQSFRNLAEYAQGTYAVTDKIKLTGGLRYTVDLTTASDAQAGYAADPVTGRIAEVNPICISTDDGVARASPNGQLSGCTQHLRQLSHAPTGLVDLDYSPTRDLLLYAKYTRGYRQGSVNAFGPPPYQTFAQEEVDAYETGFKSTFHSFVSGTFDVAGFYNSLQNQQIQSTFLAVPGLGAQSNATPINVGTSQIWGVELESSIRLFPGFTVDAGYTYLNTLLIKTTPLNLPAGSAYSADIPGGSVGGPLALSPENKVVLTGTYVLPLDQSIGRVSVSTTGTYTSSQIIFADTGLFPDPYGKLDPTLLVSASVNWSSVFGSPVDATFFVTNLTDKGYYTYLSGGYLAYGFESGEVGEPRMFGARLRYRFGH